MLYIFDLGNVIVDIDFNRVLGAWSDFSRVPLATLKQNFAMGETFHQHERGEMSDEEFAERFCQDMGLSLSYEQFSHGWQAVFVAIRPEVIDIMHKLREQGHRVVVLSNTNRLHTTFWPEEYPEVKAAADKIYLSQEMSFRAPVFAGEKYTAEFEVIDVNTEKHIGTIKCLLLDAAGKECITGTAKLKHNKEFI